MAKIIDFEAERRKRRGLLGSCTLCGFVYPARQLTMIPDDAELYILCEKCAKKMEKLSRKPCPECRREVYHLHEVDDRQVCGICYQIAQLPSADFADGEPTVPF